MPRSDGYVRPMPPQDTYFTYAESQFRALYESYDLVEYNFAELVERRGEPGWDGNPATSGQAFKDWLQQKMVDLMMPQAYRGAFLMALWATYETTVTMVGNTLRRFDRRIPPFKPPRENWLARVETYFANQLRFSLFPRTPRGLKNEVAALQRVRHVFAHANGLKQTTSSKQWHLLAPYARKHPGIQLDKGFLEVTPDFVRSRFVIMLPAMVHVIDTAREKLAVNPDFIEYETGWRPS